MPLADILATELLTTRPVTPPFPTLTPELEPDVSALGKIRKICTTARQRCGADTVGVSIFHHPHYEELTWIAVVGEGEDFQGRRYPLRHSMCGVCFDLEAPQLFIEAQRYFQWLDLASIRIAEGLVVPLRTPSGHFYGTIWMAAHAPPRQFNDADVKLLSAFEDELYALISDATVGLSSRFTSSAPLFDAFDGDRRAPRA